MQALVEPFDGIVFSNSPTKMATKAAPGPKSGHCEHGRRRSRCKECGGSGICEHGRERSQCKECGGSGICEHGRRRSACKECNKDRLLCCQHTLCGFTTLSQSLLANHEKAVHSKEVIARRKKQEQRVNNVLLSAGYTASTSNNVTPLSGCFHREQHITFECLGEEGHKRAYIDFVITLANGAVVFLEVDEEQHRFGAYSILCDLRRMAAIQESLVIDGSLHCGVTFLRYNPGAYRVGAQLQKMPKKAREEALVKHLQHLAEKAELPPKGSIQIQYCYYDKCTDSCVSPMVCNDVDYDQAFRQVARSVL